MVESWWLIVVGVAASSGGVLIAALCSARKCAECEGGITVQGKTVHMAATMIARALTMLPVGEALMALSAAKKMTKERIKYVPKERRKED